jgi:hypothetical protein
LVKKFDEHGRSSLTHLQDVIENRTTNAVQCNCGSYYNNNITTAIADIDGNLKQCSQAQAQCVASTSVMFFL